MKTAPGRGSRDHGLVAARRFLLAPVGLVWSVFVDVDTWADWTDTMRVWSQGSGGMHTGSELAFEVELEKSTVLSRAVVREFIPPLCLTWSVESSGSGQGLHTESTWTFSPMAHRSTDGFALGLPAGTRIVNLRTLEAERAPARRADVLADSRRLIDRFLEHLEAECVRRGETGTVGTHGPALI